VRRCWYNVAALLGLPVLPHGDHHPLKGGAVGEVRTLAINLYTDVDGEQFRLVLAINEYGQLPSVLIDPVGSDGQTLFGTWFGLSRDRMLDVTHYRRIS
jgi:hypothetical protein